eukprot:1186965-Prorocentrum_minimum.AAC.3
MPHYTNPRNVAVCARCSSLALQMERFVTDNHLKGMKVAPAKIYATKWHAAHGLALSIALVCARL